MPDPIIFAIVVVSFWGFVLALRLLFVFSLKPGPCCKNCHRPLRGLANGPEIPIHADTESRFCDVAYVGELPTARPTRYAEWSE